MMRDHDHSHGATDVVDYRRDQLVRIAGRPYRVLKVDATVDGVDGLVLLGALTKARGGAAGEGGDLLAMTPEEITAQQVVPTSRRRPSSVGVGVGRGVRGKASTDEGQSQNSEGQSSTNEGQSRVDDTGISILALLIFVAFVIAVTLLLR